MTNRFSSISSHSLKEKAVTAQTRIVLAAPGIHTAVAESLTEAARRLGAANVEVILDVDERVMRLGYGNIQGVETLRAAGISVRNSPGLRIGILACDDDAWIFSPSALYIESEPHSDETPNAVQISSDEATRLLMSISEKAREKALASTDERIKRDAVTASIELGTEQASNRLIENVRENLRLAPPVPFNIARQVHVFEPFIQYIEIALEGCAIDRHKVQIPKVLTGLPRAEISDRLNTSFDLIQRNSRLSSQDVENKVNNLRETYTKSLGRDWGRIILRSRRPEIDQLIQEIKNFLEKHRKTVEDKLAADIQKSITDITEYFLPQIIKNPPAELKGQVTGGVTEDAAKRWLVLILERAFPKPESLISKMELRVDFKDVTYETLIKPDFFERLKQAFPLVDWDKPMREFIAAEQG